MPLSKRMSIGKLGLLLCRSWRVEAPGCELDYGGDLFTGKMEPFHDLVDGGSHFEIVEDDGDGRPRVLKDPRAAALSWDAFDGWALGPVENCHSVALLDMVTPILDF